MKTLVLQEVAVLFSQSKKEGHIQGSVSRVLRHGADEDQTMQYNTVSTRKEPGTTRRSAAQPEGQTNQDAPHRFPKFNAHQKTKPFLTDTIRYVLALSVEKYVPMIQPKHDKASLPPLRLPTRDAVSKEDQSICLHKLTGSDKITPLNQVLVVRHSLLSCATPNR